MKAANPSKDTELSLIKTIAVAARPLEADLPMSRLQMIDRLQKLQAKFRELWISPGPWLVMDGYALPNAPVDKMLKKMDEYGDPVGMVGIAFLPHSGKTAVLKMLFRSKADARAVRIMENAADALAKNWQEHIRQIEIDLLKGRGKTE